MEAITFMQYFLTVQPCFPLYLSVWIRSEHREYHGNLALIPYHSILRQSAKTSKQPQVLPANYCILVVLLTTYKSISHLGPSYV